jgi:hypothetical protein
MPTKKNNQTHNKHPQHSCRHSSLFGCVIASPEIIKCSGITTCSNKHAIGFSNHKHTPITETQKQGHVHWGHQFHCRRPLPSRPRSQTVFVLVSAGGNRVVQTVFPPGQRDITLDHARQYVQLRRPSLPCDNGHRLKQADHKPPSSTPKAIRSGPRQQPVGHSPEPVSPQLPPAGKVRHRGTRA